ncbi:MAG: BolA/IbaG family iron-sulfur metabolism protein [Coxiellaceae bacterium]|nr:MAG: BolA/IbaG family iron-sulfur metabolism protein [Coxiellaceae bacterium]
MVQAVEIKEWLTAGLPNAQISVEGDGQHFHAIIISPQFMGKSLLQRQRMVYAALGERMGREIHALSMQTLTPDQKA